MRVARETIMAERLSQHELGEFLNSLQQAALEGYPNPERKGCPGTEILQAVARASAPFSHPAYEHVKRCSPCLREMLELQGSVTQLERSNAAKARMHRVIAGCSLASVVLGLSFLVFFQRRGGESEKKITQVVAPSKRTAFARVPTTVPLDFRSISTQRGASEGAIGGLLQHAPRTLVKLEITLPFGSDDGVYSIEIRDPRTDSVLKRATGPATLLDGDTRLTISWLDLSDVPPGEYDFLFRHADAFWRKGRLTLW
jgi:hypothetical protein